jgi:hypothetical protein
MALTKVKLIADGTIVQSNLHASHGITTADIGENASYLYYTDARARAAVSVSGNALSYNSSTGVITSNFEESPVFTGTVTINNNAPLVLNGTDPLISFQNGGSNHWQVGFENTQSDRFIFYDNNAASYRMVINSSGNVGIGTTSPGYKLEVAGTVGINSNLTMSTSAEIRSSDGTGIRLRNAANSANEGGFVRSGLWEGDSSRDPSLFAETGLGLRFYTGGSATERMLINSSGNTTFTGTLDVASTIYTAESLRFDGTGLNATDKKLYSPTDGCLEWFTHQFAGTPAFAVSHQGTKKVLLNVSGNSYLNGGNVGIGTTSPTSIASGYTSVTTNGTNGGGLVMQVNGTATGYLYAESGALVLTNTSGVMQFYNTGSERMRIDSSGNVGIGTTSPSTKLDVRGGSGGGSFDHATFTSVTNRGLKISTANSSEGQNGAAVIYNAQDGENYGSHAFQIGGSTKMFIKGNNVGIGTTSLVSKLDLVQPDSSTSTLGQSATASLGIRIANSVGQVGQIVFNNDAAPSYGYGSIGMVMTSGSGVGLGDMIFSTKSVGTDSASTERMRIDSNGDVGIGTTSPSSGAKLDVDGNLAIGNGYQINLTHSLNSNNLWYGMRYDNDEVQIYTYFASNRSITFNTVSGGTTITSQLMKIESGGNVGIGTASPSDKLEVSSGNIRIVNNSPMLRFRDSDVTNLEHRVLGGGNQGLEYSADVNNVTAGYHRWDIASSEKMRLIENGNLGINTTSPDGRLDVRGAISSGMALEDENVSLTSNGGTPQGTGTLEISQGWSASTSSGDTIVFRHNSTSWKAWVLHYNFASTNGITVGVIGGYWNNSGSSSNTFIENNLGASVAVTHGGTGNQNIIVTFTFTALGTHPLSSFKYIQHGGDGKPLASKTSITLNS